LFERVARAYRLETCRRRGADRHLDLQFDEAFDKIDADRRHRVTVVLVSNELLTSKAGKRR